ncbi:hypothetical protein K501DRAFT_168688 [Backusella circina FSU 941]|nr:hypothetical protein K501DRAFT_168688 [Backusella circina FSU 941]
MQVRAILITFAALFVALIAAAPVEKRSTFSGTATWYDPVPSQGGNLGSCYGKSINKDMAIVALNSKQYGNLNENSDLCGSTIKITGPAGTTTATILDACPECGYGSLDLTPAVFKKVVGDLDIGMGDIEWHIV